jgi:phosphoribosylformimino-5-aminoimidazole carboxamide ribotide isomerase
MFRPCIDLHEGRVKQVVGATFGVGESAPRTNFVSEHGASWFADLFRSDDLRGGHVIQLGPGNGEAAHSALAAFPGGLQLGGGVNADNASGWIEAGASHVIVTSWLFPGARLDRKRAETLAAAVGADRVVVDLSARLVDGRYVVFIDRWRTPTTTVLDAELFAELADVCDEFLVHAINVEGLQQGIDTDLVEKLAAWCPKPVTYAGGARSLDDLRHVHDASGGRVDLTIGSALDIFGGSGVTYRDAVAFNLTFARAD